MWASLHRLIRFLYALALGGLVYAYVHDHTLRNRIGLGVIAGVLVFLVIEGGGVALEARREARAARGRARAREAQILAEERLRHRVRQELASEEAVSGALSASSTGLPVQAPDQPRLSLVGGDSGPAAGARRRSRARTVLVRGSPVIMVALIVLLLLLGQPINHGSP
jgi:hypothetical protein